MDSTLEKTTHPHLRATLLLSCLAQFMVILDVSVVNVALPAIRGGLHFSEVDLQWVVNAYTVTFAGFLLLGGRAADLLGRRKVFVSGLTLFALASLAGGLADSQTMLIAARAVQGLGGAVIAPASLSILTTTFPEGRERNRAVGIWGAMGGAGGAAGVLLGGVLTDLLGWRWILFINVPIGLLAAVFAQRLIAEGRNPDRARDFDLRGAVSATAGLSLLVLGIVRTDVTGWGSLGTLALIASGVALLVVFIVIEGRFAHAPLMPLRIWTSRTLASANTVVMLVGGSTFGMWFFLSLYLQQVLGYSPIRAGLAFLPMTLCIVIGSALASRAVDPDRRQAAAAGGDGRADSRAGSVHRHLGGRHLPWQRARAVAAGRDRDRALVRAGDDPGSGRGRAAGGGARVGARQHVATGGRRARARDPGRNRDRKDQRRPAQRRRSQRARGADERLSGGVPGRRGVCVCRCRRGVGRPAAARAARACGARGCFRSGDRDLRVTSSGARV